MICTCSDCPVHHSPLAIARRRAGLTLKEAARVVGCSTSTIANAEAGRHRLCLANAEALRIACSPHLDGIEIPTRESGRPKTSSLAQQPASQ